MSSTSGVLGFMMSQIYLKKINNEIYVYLYTYAYKVAVEEQKLMKTYEETGICESFINLWSWKLSIE